MVFVGGVLGVELGDPGLDGRKHFGRRVAAEFAAGTVSGAVFGLLEVLEEFGHGGAVDLGGLQERTLGVGDAVDAAVLVVAVRIAGVMLHVPDQRVVPVEEVERAVRGEFEVDRTEVAVGGCEQVAVGLADETGAVVMLRAEADAEEADGVAGHEVALLRVGEVAGGDELGAGAGAGALGDELLDLDLLDAVRHLRGERQGPPVLARRSVGNERLFPVVEGIAPRIGDVELLALQPVGLRVEAPHAAVVAAAGSVGGLHLAVEEASFEQVERARSVRAIGRDRVVRVVGVETVQDQLHAVRLAVLVVVDEQGEVRFLGDVDALRRDLEADRDVEVVGEDRLLVGLAVAVGVFEDDDLVVGHRVARAVRRVGRRRGDPEATFGVEGHLHGLLQVREFLLGCEERDFVARGEGHLADGGFARKEFGRIAVLLAGLEVGGHGREDERLGIVDGEVGALALDEAVDELVADGGHLAALEDLVGVVLRSERIVALSVGVHAVDDRVIRVPHVVLHLHGGVDQRFVGLGCAGRDAKESVGEELGHLAVAEVGRGEAVDGIGRLAVAVGGEGGVEEVDVGEAVFLRDTLHRRDVKGEVGVFLHAVREVALGGEVLEADGRDEDEARGALAVVGPGERVLDEGVELGFVVGGAGGPVEGFVIAEEGDDGVGLQVEQPLVRRGEESFAVMLRVFGMELLGAGEGPLAGAGGVRAEGGSVARTAHVAHDEVLFREAELQLGLETAIVSVAFGEAVADEDHMFA